MNKMLVTTIGLLLAGKSLAMPGWAKSNTMSRNGNTLSVVCSGQGKTIGDARKKATEDCKSSAVDQTVTDLKVSSRTLENNRSTEFESEITSGMQADGVKCKPLKEEIEQLKDGFQVWLQCSFDLSNIRLAPINPTDAKMYILSIYAKPTCDEIVIYGLKNTRAEKCKKTNGKDYNAKVLILSTDTKIVFKAKGFEPIEYDTRDMFGRPWVEVDFK